MLQIQELQKVEQRTQGKNGVLQQQSVMLQQNTEVKEGDVLEMKKRKEELQAWAESQEKYQPCTSLVELEQMQQQYGNIKMQYLSSASARHHGKARKTTTSMYMQSSAHKQQFAKSWQMMLKWRDGAKAPFKLCRGAAACNGNVAYFMNWNGETCSYINNSTNRKWSVLPKYFYQYATLVVISGKLTAIGGCSGNVYSTNMYTNQLFSLHDNTTWEVVFPPMPTKRQDTSAASSKTHVIVAGGMCGPFINSSVATVEVMDIETLSWSTVASLPHPYTGAFIAISGDGLFMLGGFDNRSETKSALTCSLTELLQSSVKTASLSVWHRIADTPAYQSSCASPNGEILAVGGCEKEGKASDAVHKYNPTTNSWDLITQMPTARYNSLTAVLPNNEIIVVGGDVHWNGSISRVEIASFN